MPWNFFWKLRLSPGIFCEPWIWPRDFFWKFPVFFKAEPVSLAWQLWWSPGWAKHFRDGTSKTRMKTRLPDVGEVERRRIVDHRRDRYESLAVIHGPKEKKTQWSQGVIARSISPSSFTKSASFRSLFRRPNVATVLHFTFFFYVDAQLQVGQASCSAGESEEKQPSVTLPVLVTEA